MKKRKKLFAGVCLLLFLCVFCFFQNNHLTVSSYVYESVKVKDELSGYRIVQVSDLHNKLFGANQSRLIQKIASCKPDLIVVTGDVVDSNHFDTAPAIMFLENAGKIAPVYYVTGNHEYWLGREEREELFEQMKQAGVKCLFDEAVQILPLKEAFEKEPQPGFVLVGLDDKSLSGDIRKLPKQSGSLWENTDDGRLVLMLAHEPQYWKEYAKTGADLVLCGHAHGGQIVLPFVGGLVAPDQGFLPEYTEGMHAEGDTTMIVSRGLGNSIIPVRLFNYPEIVCVELQSKLSEQ